MALNRSRNFYVKINIVLLQLFKLNIQRKKKDKLTVLI